MFIFGVGGGARVGSEGSVSVDRRLTTKLSLASLVQSPRMPEVLSVRNIVKSFGPVRAVDGVSFSVRQGTITGLLGRNGAGKTTTIRMITGIFLPDSGTIEWEHGGRDRIGYLPEERGLYRQMKVFEHLLFLAEIKGVRGAGVGREVDGWLERF